MKRNKLFILGICTVMVALVSLSLVSGTWAKYTSTVSGSDQARVAKWAFTYKNEAGNAGNIVNESEGIQFDLFNTVQDTGGTAENDVKVGATETIIAPGTSGSFVLTFTNASEVNAKYAVVFAGINTNNIPLQFSFDGATWVNAINELEIADTNIAMGATASQTVYWRWVFDAAVDATPHPGQSDATDTALGINGEFTYQVSATVKFTQVD